MASSNIVRRDHLGRLVVLTALRSSRPHDFGHQKQPKVQQPKGCFFCPGNEHLTPPEIFRIEKEGRWEVRVFPNKFPAFDSQSKSAYGRHEVIVETPNHYATLSELSVENLFDYLSALSLRLADAKKDPKLKYTSIFKNEGKEAGCSLEHSHSQLVSMPFIPPFIKKLSKKSKAFAKLASSSKLCWASNQYFVALCPKAPRFHLETLILPKQPEASMDLMDAEKLYSLAEILKTALVAIDRAANFPPYNIIFHNAPHGMESFPFHLQIIPRLSIWAGFELSTEIVMLSDSPVQMAEKLRKASIG
ncbi:MAG: DUF4921 family protein [Candidatus Micrarchaeota archaeon]|nr:DUF4921 family protein [Candidatus Micrarchaeota archaeon]